MESNGSSDDLLSHPRTKESPSRSSPDHSNSYSRSSIEEIIYFKMKTLVKIKTINSYNCSNF